MLVTWYSILKLNNFLVPVSSTASNTSTVTNVTTVSVSSTNSINVTQANTTPAVTAPLMNNGSRDKTSSDMQKLQQQLHDIKEQVKLIYCDFIKY